MYTLIADCGSTKCDWLLINLSTGEVSRRFQTEGINLAIASEDSVSAFVFDMPLMPNVVRIEFYGAGVKINPVNDKVLASSLSKMFRCNDVRIDTDLVGAARALFGNRPGIACILGTGSNSGVYDGETILANTPPLGFILGDEGSGAAMGKRLVNAVFKGLLPDDLARKFFESFPVTKQELIENVYRRPGANFYLAQFSKFLSANIDHPSVAQLVEDEFCAFVAHNLLPYKEMHRGISYCPVGETFEGELKVGFVGSIAHHFEAQLRNVFRKLCPVITDIRILQSPVDGLINRD